MDRGQLLGIAGVGIGALVHDAVVLLEHLLEEAIAALALHQRQHRLDGGPHVTVHRHVDVGAPAQLVGVLHAGGRGAVAQQAGHAHVVGVVVLDEVLAAQ